MKILNKSVVIIEASTKFLEDSNHQKNPSTVAVLHEQIPDTINLLPYQNDTEFIWITIVQHNSSDIEETFRKMHENRMNLQTMHTSQWQQFWVDNRITAEGNTRLSNVISASIFALVSGLPSSNTSHPQSSFFGLSPSGIGLDNEVYHGHSFWDTEMWMQPSIILLQPHWSRELLNYRYSMRNTAKENAINTGYNGYRFEFIEI